MSKFMMMICCVCALVVMADITDIQLREILERAVSYIDDPDGGPCEVQYAIQVSGGDTNRVVSMMKQLIDEGNRREGITGFYISQIGKYGTNSDLSFLYQRAATTNFCRDATVAVLSIESLTTNSLTQLNSRIPDERPGAWKPVRAWCSLLAAAKKLPIESAIRAATVSNAVCYASRQTESVELFDGCLIKADPTYQMSKRRLAVLRSVRDLGPNECQTNFVTRIIHELESYPEANLPE